MPSWNATTHTQIARNTKSILWLSSIDRITMAAPCCCYNSVDGLLLLFRSCCCVSSSALFSCWFFGIRYSAVSRSSRRHDFSPSWTWFMIPIESRTRARARAPLYVVFIDERVPHMTWPDLLKWINFKYVRGVSHSCNELEVNECVFAHRDVRSTWCVRHFTLHLNRPSNYNYHS